MATSSIFKNMEFDDEMIRRIFKAIGDSKRKQKEDNKFLCDYCGKEMDFKDTYWRKIGDKSYYGHKHCMMNMIKEEE